MKRLAIPLIALALASPAHAGKCALDRQAYAPADDLEAIDVALLGQATRTIDMAAYVLTSVPIVDALDKAAARGVRVRLYRDASGVNAQTMPKPLGDLYDRLVARLNVEARYKGYPAPFMHLKGYSVDGRFVREGAGNFTHSGLKRQDNSLIVLHCRAAVKRFQSAFETMWSR